MTTPSGKTEWVANRRSWKQPAYEVVYHRGRTPEQRAEAYLERLLRVMGGRMAPDARRYTDIMRGVGCTIASIANTAFHFRRFSEANPMRTLATITPDDVRSTIDAYSKTHKPDSVVVYVKHIHAWLNWHYDEEIPKLIRRALQRRPARGPERRALTRAEFDKLLAQARKRRNNLTPARSVALLWVLWDSGMRVSEALALRRNSVAKDADGVVTLTLPPDAPRLKTGPRTVYVAEAAPYIEEWMREMPTKRANAPFFCQRKATQRAMLPGNVANLILRLSTRARVRHVHPHLLRHTRATRAAEAGWNEFEMNAFFGWGKESRTASRYVHMGQLHLHERVQRDHRAQDDSAAPMPGNLDEVRSELLHELAAFLAHLTSSRTRGNAP